MKRRLTWIFGLVLLTCAPLRVAAQEKGASGIVATTSSAVGFIWHVSERVALRPEVSFSTTSLESEGVSGDNTGSTIGLGASLPITVRRWNDLSIYVSPRFSWSRSTTISETVSGLGRSRFETTTTGYSSGASFGAHYIFGERFGVFGETGLVFSRQRSESDSDFSVFPIGDRTANSFSTRSSLGVIFYF